MVAVSKSTQGERQYPGDIGAAISGCKYPARLAKLDYCSKPFEKI